MNCANHPDRERKAFCQNCGKPLCAECARTVGHAVFCEPCLEARLSATAGAAGDAAPFGAGPTAGSAKYTSVPGGGTAYRYTGTAEGIPYDVRGVTPPPGTPPPAIAALLGFIPGVGAMYNGQYAKGIVHLIIFAVLASLADQNSIFGIFVAAWIFYQAIEAYHTARARRDRTPLPNPFGLNDIGERFGFGRGWPGAGPAAPFAPPAPGEAPPPSAPYTPPASAAAQAGYAAGSAGYPPPQRPSVPPSSYAASPFTAPPYTADPAAAQAPWGAPANVYTATANPYVAAPPTVASGSRFPVGAVVLIGLGLLFLLGSTRFLAGFPLHFLLPALLIGVGVWVFVRRMTSTGTGFTDDGTPAYRLRLIRALQSSIWIILTGILFLLDNLNILSWGRSWPLFIIVGGVMAFLQRGAYTAAAAQTAYTYQPAPVPNQPVPDRPVPPVSPVEPVAAPGNHTADESTAGSSTPGGSTVPRDREGV